MTKTMRASHTLEFKQEAVRLVEGGQSIAAAARTPVLNCPKAGQTSVLKLS